MLRWFCGDLHMHTVLSPCAELSMGPVDLVATAVARGLDFIAITDHNSAENVGAYQLAAADTPLQVLAGIEVSTREEIHMIALFPELVQALDFQGFLYGQLQEGQNDPTLWGPQLLVDAHENILGENPRLLGLPVRSSYDRIMQEVIGRGGLIYPAHIDRRANSMVHTLGFLPADLPFKVVELSSRTDPKQAMDRYSSSGLQLITASDAHDVAQIGSARCWFCLEEFSFAELMLACTSARGRSISLLAPEVSSRTAMAGTSAGGQRETG